VLLFWLWLQLLSREVVEVVKMDQVNRAVEVVMDLRTPIFVCLSGTKINVKPQMDAVMARSPWVLK